MRKRLVKITKKGNRYLCTVIGAMKKHSQKRFRETIR